jgi:FkbM family methyltransferase
MAKKARPLVRRTGWDVVPYPGIRHQRLRAQTLEHLGVDLVLDVGANIGQFGGDVRAFGYTGDMVSYEPMREAFTQLEGAAAGDPRWTPVRSAIGAEAGELELHIAGNSISSSLLPMADRHADIAPLSVYVGAEKVPVERLDAIAAEAVTAATAPFLKIDTQGYESLVLDGAEGILDQLVGIELELSLVTLYEGQALMGEMVERMGDAGFGLWALSPGLVDTNAGQTLQMDGIFVGAAVPG